MSHFTVLVIGENWEEQLAPYNENLAVDPPVKKLIPKEDVERALADRGEGETDEFLISEYTGCDVIKDVDDWYELSTYNPKSKWDWYLMGGRWRGFLKVKPGCTGKLGKAGLFASIIDDPLLVDQCLKAHLDIEGMRKARVEEALKEWDELEPGRREIYFPDYKDRADLIAKVSADAFSTFAYVKDGEWHEKGTMGWWALVSNQNPDWKNEFSEMFNSLPEDTILTLVDCHI